jgi:hypothetical protein
MRFGASEPADHSTTAVFIQGYDRFLRELRNARRLRIEAQFFHNGSRVLEFAVAELKWDDVPKPRAPAAPRRETSFRESAPDERKSSEQSGTASTVSTPTREDCIQRWAKANGGRYVFESYAACQQDPMLPAFAKLPPPADSNQPLEEIRRDSRTLERKAREQYP